MGIALVAALGICFLYALFGKTDQERTPLIAVSVGFGTVIGFITIMGYLNDSRGWDVMLFSVLLFVGTLNAVYGTLDIYDDTVKRAPAGRLPTGAADATRATFTFTHAHPRLTQDRHEWALQRLPQHIVTYRHRYRRPLRRLPLRPARWLCESQVHRCDLVPAGEWRVLPRDLLVTGHAHGMSYITLHTVASH